MKSISLYILLATLVLISPAQSEILVFKNGKKIETNYRWDVPPDKIGFFYNGKEYRANKKDIDWEKTEQLNNETAKVAKPVQTPLVSTEDFTGRVQENMDALWEVRRLSLNNRTLRITTGIRSLDAETYHKMVVNICRDLRDYPEIAKTLKEIVFLGRWETHGWVFESPAKFNEILQTPAGERETVIAKYTHKHSRD